MKYKVMTILGTRPEIIRLSAIIQSFDEHFDHILVHTGQNYDYKLNQVFFNDLELRAPDYYLDASKDQLGQALADIISKSYQLIKEIKPDAVFILGDTNSALSSLSAKRLKTPLFHMEAGNRCFDENVPEEINRRIVDHISDVNLCYTENSRRYLLSEGFQKDRIYVIGSPMKEVLDKHQQKINASNILDQMKLKSKSYILVSTHREENIDLEPNFTNLFEALNEVAETYQIPVVLSTHPRTRKRLVEKAFDLHPLIMSVEPFGFTDYVKLMKEAKVVLSDSGTLSEESSILKFKAVLIRTSTERPEALDFGSIIVSGIKKHEILSSIKIALDLDPSFDSPKEYLVSDVSNRAVRIVQSYIPIINERVWRKKG